MTIDHSALNAYRDVMGNDADSFIADIVQIYLNSSKSLLAKLDTAFAAKDVVTFNRAAHTLKSSSATVGAMSVANLAAVLEEATIATFSPNVDTTLAKLKYEYRVAEVELRHILDGLQ
jgi:HPt (histidine-containing phosphotransfer) domain-containing protein